MNTELVQQEIDRIILDVNTRGWRFNRVTKKALAKIDELGLRSYITEWMTRDGAKSDAIINEIIKQAKDAGGKVVTERGASFDDATTYITKPSKLYTLLTEPAQPEVIDAPVLTDAQVSDAGQDDKFRHVNEVVNNAMLNLMEADAQQPHRVAFHKIYSHIVDIENDYHLGNESKPDTIYEVTDFARRCIRLLEVLESQDIPEVNGFLRAFGKQQA